MTKTGDIEIKKAGEVPKECVRAVTIEGIKFNVYVKGLVKVEEEIKKLRKNEGKLENVITRLEKKMGTEKYKKTP